MSGILQGVIASIAGSQEYGAVGWANSPYLTFFKKESNRLIQLTDPASMPSAAIVGITWSRFGNFVGVLTAGSVVSVYSLSGDTVTQVWNADFSGVIGIYGGNITHIAWTKERNDTGTDNFLSLFFPDGQFYYTESKSVIRNSNVFNDYDSVGLGNIIGAAFLLNYNNSDGAAIIARSVGAEYLFCVELSGLGSSFLPGRILTQPSVAPLYVASRNDGTAFAVVLNGATNNILIYTRSGANWDIAHTLSAGGTPTRCAWSADGNFLGVAHGTTPYYSVVDFTSGSPTVVAGTTALAAAGNDITMSRDNFSALTATSSSNFLQVQQRNSNGVWNLSATIDFSFTESNALAVSLKNNAYVGN
jgi:hypothetical protein